MEVYDLTSALEATLALLRQSSSNLWARVSVAEMIAICESELEKTKGSLPVDFRRLKFLFLPGGPLQEVAKNNGWGKEFMEIWKVMDRYKDLE